MPPHSSAQRWGLAKIELLVVAVVVSLLGGGIVLAVAEDSEKNKAICFNNQHNIGIALIRDEGVKDRFPGYSNNQNPDKEKTGGTKTGWVYPILLYLDRSDIYDRYGTKGEQPGTEPTEHLNILVCPLHDEAVAKAGTRMSYVVNTGLLGDLSPENSSLGVFVARYRSSKKQLLALSSMGKIPDGLAFTLMLAENLDAGNWTSPEEGCGGFTWQSESPPTEGFLINAKKGTATCKLPRPSSRHAGGVVATFCDGHSKFLSEKVDYAIYQKLMTPNGNGFDPPQGEIPRELLDAQ